MLRALGMRAGAAEHVYASVQLPTNRYRVPGAIVRTATNAKHHRTPARYPRTKGRCVRALYAVFGGAQRGRRLGAEQQSSHSVSSYIP